jgi:hypothetical protein
MRVRRTLLPLGAGACAALLAVPLFHPAYFPLSLPLLLLVVPAAQFALTPLWRRVGVYRYYSPMLFVVARGDRVFELHGGTAYDFVLHMHREERGFRARRRWLSDYVAGLLGLIRDVETGRIPPDARISGTSYFFSEQTALRLGFTLERPGRADRLHLLLDLLSLAAMHSYARNRLTLPRFWALRKASITAAALARQKPALQRLLERIS